MVRPTKIFVGSLADGVTNEDVRALFEKIGKVVECDVLGKYGFVHMERSDEAERAINELSGFNLKGQPIRVMPSISPKPPKTKIFVGSLPQDCKEEDLKQLFEKYGKVTECAVLGIYGFVHMDSIDEAQNAIRELNNYKFKGSSLRVETSTGEKRQPGAPEGFNPSWRGGFGGGRGAGRPHPYARPPMGGMGPPPPGMRRMPPFRDDMFIGGRPDDFPRRPPMKPEFSPRPPVDDFFRRSSGPGPMFERRPDEFMARRPGPDEFISRRPPVDYPPRRAADDFPPIRRADEFAPPPPRPRPDDYAPPPPRRMDDYVPHPPRQDDFGRGDFGMRRSEDFMTRRPDEPPYREDMYSRRSMDYPTRSLAPPQNGHPEYYRRPF